MPPPPDPGDSGGHGASPVPAHQPADDLPSGGTRPAADGAAAPIPVDPAPGEAAVVPEVPLRADAAVALPPDQVTRDVLGTPIDRFDDAVDRLWGRAVRGHPAVDRLFYLASDLGDFSLIWHLIGTAQGLRSERDADATLRLAGVLLVESLVVNQGIKRLFRRPRPLATEPRPHHLRRPVTSSFPSGHASSAFTAAGVLSAHDPKLAPAYYTVAVVVATSRLHVRIHHASDVIAGAALGALFARAAVRLWPLPPR